MSDNCIVHCLNPAFSDCVFYSGTNIESDCFTICSGDTLTKIIQSFADTICEINQSGKIKVNSSDLCLGYLEDKITSTDESVSIEVNTDEDGCKTLDLSVSDTNILLSSQWEDVTANLDDLMSYLLNAGSLETDGDELEIEGNLALSTGQPELDFYFETQIYRIFTFSGVSKVNASIKLSRISNTQIRWRVNIKFFDSSGTLIGEQSEVSSNLTVSNLDSVNITIRFTNGTAVDVTQEFMDVKIYKV